MSTVTVSRSDLAADEVTAVLRSALGGRYDVLPGQTLDRSAASESDTAETDGLVVQSKANRLLRAQVTLVRGDVTRTTLQITPGGLPGTWPGGIRLINRLGVARKTRLALQASFNPT